MTQTKMWSNFPLEEGDYCTNYSPKLMKPFDYHMLLDQINTIYWTADRSMHKSDWNTTLFHVLANNINEDDYE